MSSMRITRRKRIRTGNIIKVSSIRVVAIKNRKSASLQNTSFQGTSVWSNEIIAYLGEDVRLWRGLRTDGDEFAPLATLQP